MTDTILIERDGMGRLVSARANHVVPRRRGTHSRWPS
jgi:hypothetical protein